MKVYIRAAKTVQQLKEQDAADLTDAALKTIVELDPTSNYANGRGGKYCPWLLKQHKLGNLTPRKVDYTNLKDDLRYFSQYFRDFEKKDINQYKTIEEFMEAAKAEANRERTPEELARMEKKRLKKQAHNAGDADKELLVTDGVWEVWTPKTYAGSISIARMGGDKADWCTAYEGNDYYYNYYTNKGKLYCFINTSDPHEKYQLHFEEESWYDIRDNGLGMEAFYDFCNEHKAIGEYFKIRNEGGVLVRGDSILKYDPQATEVNLPEGVTELPKFNVPKSVTKFVCPSTLKSIRGRAFMDSSIETFIGPAVTSIEIDAFRGSKIRNIDLSNVTDIGPAAFRFCTNLTSVNLNPNVKIGPQAFAGANLTGEFVMIPTYTLSDGALDGNKELTVIWQDEDSDYGFNDIKLLVLDKNACPELFAENDGWVPLELI